MGLDPTEPLVQPIVPSNQRNLHASKTLIDAIVSLNQTRLQNSQSFKITIVAFGNHAISILHLTLHPLDNSILVLQLTLELPDLPSLPCPKLPTNDVADVLSMLRPLHKTHHISTISLDCLFHVFLNCIERIQNLPCILHDSLLHAVLHK